MPYYSWKLEPQNNQAKYFNIGRLCSRCEVSDNSNFGQNETVWLFEGKIIMQLETANMFRLDQCSVSAAASLIIIKKDFGTSYDRSNNYRQIVIPRGYTVQCHVSWEIWKCAWNHRLQWTSSWRARWMIFNIMIKVIKERCSRRVDETNLYLLLS